MSSVYSNYIKRMRMCANENCKGCTYQYEGLTNTEECKEDLIYDAAEQLEDADKCNAKLSKKCKEMEKRIAELKAQIQQVKSQIYDLEDTAKRAYDDDSDNEYLEGYFDGLHHAAKLISTTSTTEER